MSGQPDPRKMSTAEIVRCYKKQEELARKSLTQLQAETANRRMATLISQTFRQAETAMSFRMALRRYQLLPDAGHDDAIRWIYNNVVLVAENIRVCNSIFVEVPTPRNPLDASGSRPPRQVDDSSDDQQAYLSASALSRATFMDPTDDTRAYFLCDVQCIMVRVNPSSTDDYIVQDISFITEKWRCLIDAGFYSVDAVLPNAANRDEVYFFHRDRYALVNISKDKIANGPKIIVDEWPSLRLSGFQSVDAILPRMNDSVPNDDFTAHLPSPMDEAYFFSSTQYSRIKNKPGTNEDELLNGPKGITDEWPSLRESGFSTIDAALPVSKKIGEAYFFSGTDYCRVNIAPGSNDDTIVLSRRDVADNWPSLRKAFFY